LKRFHPSKMGTNYHHGDLKNALIRSGLEILSTQGIQDLSLRKVARAAGVSEAAPYRHFKDKETLLAAIAEQGFIRLAERLEQMEEQYAEDARSLFYQSSRAYIQFARDNPHSMRVMFRFRNTEDEVRFPDLQEAADEVFSYFIDIVEYCQQAGLARAGHPLPLALAAWSTVHGLSMLLIDRCISPDVFHRSDENTMITAALDMVLTGWQAHPY